MGEHFRFLRTFLQYPVLTGAAAPSSTRLARRMVEGMGLEEAETVVELGPGTGSFTRAILDRIGPRTLVLALEVNRDFAAGLERCFQKVKIVNDSAERLDRHLAANGRTSADCIVSGLPWAGFAQDRQERLMRAVVAALRPGGRFATFAYVHACWLPPGRRLRRMLNSHFAEVEMSPVVWRNLPPAFAYRCRR